MISEAKASEHDVPIDIAPFSTAIMSGRPLAEPGKVQSLIYRWNSKHWMSSAAKKRPESLRAQSAVSWCFSRLGFRLKIACVIDQPHGFALMQTERLQQF
jgi:hypothetical protein